MLSEKRKQKALISFAVTANLICAFFSPVQIVGFPMGRLIGSIYMKRGPMYL